MSLTAPGNSVPSNTEPSVTERPCPAGLWLWAVGAVLFWLVSHAVWWHGGNLGGRVTGTTTLLFGGIGHFALLVVAPAYLIRAFAIRKADSSPAWLPPSVWPWLPFAAFAYGVYEWGYSFFIIADANYDMPERILFPTLAFYLALLPLAMMFRGADLLRRSLLPETR